MRRGCGNGAIPAEPRRAPATPQDLARHELARALERDYCNLHADVAALSEWLAVQREEDGRVSVPWTEIIVDMKLPHQLAA